MAAFITVITPVFNGERFIEKCIHSVAAQACDGVEHLIIDGGSSDDTVAIIERAAKHHPHLRWISEPDDGQSDAMNKGIRWAQGQVVSFLNVDDYYEPGVLQRVRTLFNTELAREPALAVANCQVWDDDNQLLYVNRPNRLHVTDLLLGWNYAQHPVNPSAYFYHKSLHDRVGDYAVTDHHAMDLDFMLRAVQVARVYYCDEIWGNYRFIVGTKTYDDTVKGAAKVRVRDMLNRYRHQLPFWQRAHLKIKRKLWRREQRRRNLALPIHAGM